MEWFENLSYAAAAFDFVPSEGKAFSLPDQLQKILEAMLDVS